MTGSILALYLHDFRAKNQSAFQIPLSIFINNKLDRLQTMEKFMLQSVLKGGDVCIPGLHLNQASIKLIQQLVEKGGESQWTFRRDIHTFDDLAWNNFPQDLNSE